MLIRKRVSTLILMSRMFMTIEMINDRLIVDEVPDPIMNIVLAEFRMLLLELVRQRI